MIINSLYQNNDDGYADSDNFNDNAENRDDNDDDAQLSVSNNLCKRKAREQRCV